MADNPLKKILEGVQEFIKGLQKGKTETVIGVDIGSSSIKVVQLRNKGGKAVLETYGAIGLGKYADTDTGRVTNLPPEKITEALKEVIKEAGITTTAAEVAIPATTALAFILELPGNLKESEIAGIVPTEARRYVPVPISEVALDWFTIPTRGDEEQKKQEVLVVAIPNEVVSKYRTIAKDSGLQVGTFEHEVFSSIRSNFEHELTSVLLMDMGASKTKLTIVDRGIVKVVHIINRGSQDISNAISKSLGVSFVRAEEMKKELGITGSTNENIAEIIKPSMDYMLSETNSVVLNYEKKYNKVVDKIILTGGGSLLKGFLEIAEERFRSDVILGDPFSKVESPAFLEETLRATGPEFGVALGLALKRLQQ